MRAATSSGVPIRPTRLSFRSASRRSSVNGPPMMSVSIEPGQTEFAVMPYGPSSRARVRANPKSAAFEPEYAARPQTPPPRSADVDETFTMRPIRCRAITRAASCVT